jgi:hypothetical protein
MFRFYIGIRGRPANWVVSIVFMLVGGVIAFLGPSIVAPAPDRDTTVIILRILGGLFLGMGTLIFVWMVGDLYFKFRHPERRDAWYWWGNFIGPLLAAGLFAVPASLAFPLMFLAYLFRPNTFFPADSPDVANNLLVGLLFSVIGSLTLGFMYFLGRARYRSRPRRQHAKAELK